MIWIQIFVAVLQTVLILLMIRYRVLTERSIGHQFDLKLEKFKQAFQTELFARERKDKFQLACIDERLKAHQEAFNLSYQFMQMLFSENVSERAKIVEQYKNFYATKSLYLTSKARKALYNAAFAFSVHNQYLEMARIERNDANWKVVKANFEEMRTAPSTIASEVDLETMADKWPFPGKEPNPFGEMENNEPSR